MNFKLQKRIGKTLFTFEDVAPSQLEFFERVSFYAELPEVCGGCGSDSITLVYREPKGYKYASIKCHACARELQFGQYREKAGALFPKQWIIPQEKSE